MFKKILFFVCIVVVLVFIPLMLTSPVYAATQHDVVAQDGLDEFAKVVSEAKIGLIPVIVLTLGLVEFSKSLGVKGNALMVESMVIGFVFYSAQYLIIMFPVIAPWAILIVYGLAGGLATTGLYTFGKRYMPDKK